MTGLMENARLDPIPETQELSMTFMRLHQTPDDPVIPEGIPIPGPRPSRSDHPPVTEPDNPPLPPAKEPPAPARRDQLAGLPGRAAR
jgi:hypothetical protein